MIVRPWGILGGRYRVKAFGAALYVAAWAFTIAFIGFLMLESAFPLEGVWATQAFERVLLLSVVTFASLCGALTTWLGEPVQSPATE